MIEKLPLPLPSCITALELGGGALPEAVGEKNELAAGGVRLNEHGVRDLILQNARPVEAVMRCIRGFRHCHAVNIATGLGKGGKEPSVWGPLGLGGEG